MKYIISFILLLLSVVAAVGLYRSSPETKKAVPKRPVPLVETMEIHRSREKVFVEAFGTVIPAQRITLQSEVEGRIIAQNPQLVPGGVIHQDDMVIQIDPSDYELLVSQSRAELEEAMFELDLEQGRQVVARREWTLLEKEIDTSDEGKSLALREPHLRLVRAKVEKAKSRLAAAELALKRTTVRAPFNALVLEEFIDKGQLVSKQSPLATLAGTDQFWVQVSVPVAVLPRVLLPGESGQPGSSVQVIFEPVNGASVVHDGHVLKIMGDLDPEGRMARLLIVIDDPLNLRAAVKGKDRQNTSSLRVKMGNDEGGILLGSYVKVMIDAGFFDNVYVVPRQGLREGDVVWVMDRESTLQIRSVQVVWRRKDEVLVTADLEQDDRLILSRIQSPLPGMMVKSEDKGGEERQEVKGERQ